jgi:hypothetical protein
MRTARGKRTRRIALWAPGRVSLGLVLLACSLATSSATGFAQSVSSAEALEDSVGGPQDPSKLLPEIDQRRAEKESVFPASPLGWLHDWTGEAKRTLHDTTGLELGIVFAHLFQGLSNAIKDQDRWGTASTFDMLGTWSLINAGQPTEGQATFHVQSRWDYGTRGPEDLGALSLGSLIGTGDTFARYVQGVILRNLYWRQGSPEAGWSYRIGKITPDGIPATSQYLDSQTTFLPSGGVSPAAIASPWSGLSRTPMETERTLETSAQEIYSKPSNCTRRSRLARTTLLGPR